MKNKDKFYMNLAAAVSAASYANRLRVGAVIIKDNNIISFGYNGTPTGFDNLCEDKDNNTKPEVLHAESNAITKCAKSTMNAEGSTLYVTTAPCFDCAKLIIQSGIIRVVYLEPYRNENGLELLKKANISYDQI